MKGPPSGGPNIEYCYYVAKGGKMSTLNRPYEISLWEDVLDDEGNFQEKRLLVIGSNEMLSQDRA
jgi:hypothetical protein